MSHIASTSFYENVQKEIIASKENNYALYYEGVRPWTKESTDAFNRALGINFTPDLYQNFSRLYGVVAQNNSDFLGLINKKDYNIDLSLDEVITIYEEKKSHSDTHFSQETSEIVDINTEIVTSLSQLSERQLGLLRVVNQSILNFMMKHSGLRDFMIESLGNQDIFSVILDERNIYLVEEILTRGDDKIHIIYGLLHFQGVLELLQTHDPQWKIIETTSSQVITQFAQ